MSRKRRNKQVDKNQLLLFSDLEMSGKAKDAVIDALEDVSSVPQVVEQKPTVSDKHLPNSSIDATDNDSCSHTAEELKEMVSRLSGNEVSLVAMHATLLVHKGLSPDEIYSIPSLPGMKFSSLDVKRMAYISVSRAFPNMIQSIGLDFDEDLHQIKS